MKNGEIKSYMTNKWKIQGLTLDFLRLQILQWDITQPQEKNEIMPFAATWMDLGAITLSEVIQTDKDKYHVIRLHVESTKENPDGLIYKTEMTQTQKTNSRVLKKRAGQIRRLGLSDTHCYR